MKPKTNETAYPKDKALSETLDHTVVQCGDCPMITSSGFIEMRSLIKQRLNQREVSPNPPSKWDLTEPPTTTRPEQSPTHWLHGFCGYIRYTVSRRAPPRRDS